MIIDIKLADEALAIGGEVQTIERAIVVLREICDATNLAPHLRHDAAQAIRVAEDRRLHATREFRALLRQIISAAAGAEPTTTRSDLASPATLSNG